MNCKSHLSPCTCQLRTHRTDCTQCLREPGRLERLSGLCRILQGLPGYRLHPSGLVIENVGDLSGLSREKIMTVYNLMEKDFLARNAKGNIWRAKSCYRPSFRRGGPVNIRQKRNKTGTQSLVLSLEHFKFDVHNNSIWKINTKITNKTR